MKITKRELKQIIRESVNNTLREYTADQEGIQTRIKEILVSVPSYPKNIEVFDSRIQPITEELTSLEIDLTGENYFGRPNDIIDKNTPFIMFNRKKYSRIIFTSNNIHLPHTVKLTKNTAELLVKWANDALKAIDLEFNKTGDMLQSKVREARNILKFAGNINNYIDIVRIK